MYTWDRSTDEPFEHLIQTIPLDPRGKTPTMLANLVAATVQRDQPKEVALRFWMELAPSLRDPFDTDNPTELFRFGGYRDGLGTYWSAVANQLKQRGVRPDYLVQDLEVGVTFWHLDEADRLPFFSDMFANRDLLVNHVPTEMFSVSVDDFVNYRRSDGQAARQWYNKAATNLRRDIIHDCMSEPFAVAYGEPIPHSNYNDLIPTFPVQRYMGGDPFEAAAVQNISAPECYPINYRHAPRYERCAKDPRWNALIDEVNSVRSCVPNGDVHPWIAPPGYGRYGLHTWARAADMDNEIWLWESMMNHMLAMGIHTFIFWNPDPRWNPLASQSDRFVDSWVGGKTANPEVLVLPEIPLDADVIETNGVRTTYEEFLARYGVSPS